MSLDFGLRVEADTGGAEPESFALFDANYTHNVTPMWRAAGVYRALYESDGETARVIAPVLREGAVKFEREIVEMRKLNPPNGWGDADSALKFLQRAAAACEAHPKARVRVSR